MTLPTDPPLQKLQFYATTPYSCGYLDGVMAQSLIAAPHHLIDARTYSGLIQLGFRRSGRFAYRPHCEHCNACVPVRIPVNAFLASRSQRRAWKHHQPLTTTIQPLGFRQEHLELYGAYQIERHNGIGLDQEMVDQYRNFLVQSNVESRLVEFRQDGVLKMVSVVDMVSDGISAVYTFYDPHEARASFGTFNVLWLVEWCRSLGLPYLYLGYWIAQSAKMAYKQNFLPQEGLINGEWKLIKGSIS